MESGQLKHRIVIERPTEAADSFGEPDKTWAEFIHTYARIAPVTGREFFDAQVVNEEKMIRFTIRFQAGITEKMRINWDGRIFNINAVLNIQENNDMLVLMATEGTDAG